jgi:hypothetical protein
LRRFYTYIKSCLRDSNGCWSTEWLAAVLSVKKVSVRETPLHEKDDMIKKVTGKSIKR